MKQIDAGKDKIKNPGAPTINGKNNFRTHEIPQLPRNRADYYTNMQLKSTNPHYFKDQITPKQRTTSSKNSIYNNSRYSRAHNVSNSISSTTISGASTADTVSTISSTGVDMNVNYPSKMPPILEPVKITGKYNPSKGKSHGKNIVNKAKPVKSNQPEDVNYRRKNTYTIIHNNPKMNENRETFDDDEDTNEQSEDDAKSNVTYRIR